MIPVFDDRVVRALLVGIETYAAGSLTNLDGPALDACRVASWLMSHGVRSENISLFVSPLDKNVDLCRELVPPEIEFIDATSVQVSTYLNDVLRETFSDILIVFWAGHGAMTRNEERILFFSDGGNHIKHSLNLTSFLLRSKNQLYEGHPNQHWIVDACADFLEPDEDTVAQSGISYPSGPISLLIDQHALFSACRGQQAANLTATKTGLFTSALLSVLSSWEGEWPTDPVSIFRSVINLLDQERESDAILQQLPYISHSGPWGSKEGFIESALSRRMMDNVSTAIIAKNPQPRELVELHSEEGIARFRRRSARALADAGRVAPLDSSAQPAFSEGLYVRRDIEPAILGEIDSRREPLVVEGQPGTGKTSLLWGMGSQLISKGCDVLFVQATWLLDRGRPGADISALLLGAAVASKKAGKAVVVLLDTADAVLADEHGREELVHVVESLTTTGVPVVMTCRPEEAKTLPSAWRTKLSNGLLPILGDFATEPTGDRELSEFELAVAAHAGAYRTRTGHTTQILVHQLINAVARRQSMSRMCLRPLFLQMLFALYAPFEVPENLSITALYEKYWLDRVVKDRREINTDNAVAGTDLSPSVMELGLEMLRIGSPQLELSAILASNLTNETAVEAIRRRGIGHVEDGVFVFFHQTFFEYATGRALLARGGVRAISVLAERSKEHVDDFFVLAVLEQTWLCALLRHELRVAALGLAEEWLTDKEAEKVVPGPLKQTILAVLVQAPILPLSLCKRVTVAALEEEYDIVAPAVRLLPVPSRRISSLEIEVAQACLTRNDRVRTEGLQLVERLSSAEPRAVADQLSRLPLVPTEAGRELEHDNLVLAVKLLPYNSASVLESLTRIVRHAKNSRQSSVLDRLVRLLAEWSGDYSEEVVNWSDRTFPSPEPRLQYAVALLHRNKVILQLEQDKAEAILTRFAVSLSRIENGDYRQGERNVLAGTLLAAGHEKASYIVDTIWTLLISCSNPQLHAWLHQGLLVELINTSPSTRLVWLAQAMASGLPAPSSHAPTRSARWADTLRRTVERTDVPLHVCRNFTSDVQRLTRFMQPDVGDDFWLSPDYGLSLLVRAAASGEEQAIAVLAGLAAGKIDPPSDSRRNLSQRARKTEGSAAEYSTALKILITLGDVMPVATLIRSMAPTIACQLQTAPLLQDLIDLRLLVKDPWQRSAVWDLIKAAVQKDLVLWPTLALIEEEVARAKGDPPLALIELLEAGLVTRVYPSEQVMSMLTMMLQLRSKKFNEKKESLLRRLYVRTFAIYAPAKDSAKVLDKAFESPIEKNLIAYAASLIIDEHRQSDLLDVAEKMQVITSVAHRASSQNVSKVAAKAGASAWAAGIRGTIAMASDEQVRSLASCLPAMRIDFSLEIVKCLNLHYDAALRDICVKMTTNPDVKPELRSVLSGLLKQSTASSGSSLWLTLDDDLVQPGHGLGIGPK